MNDAAKPRARDLGIPFDGTPGPCNAITDVRGVEVGYTTLRDTGIDAASREGVVCTGVTAILPRGRSSPPKPVWAGQFDLNGNGELTGAHWIRDAGYFHGPIVLTNTHAVGIAHHAAVGWMLDNYAAYYRDNHAWAMPVIGETYDGLVNDICARHVRESHVLAALEAARPGLLAEGNVGGGTGMQTYEFKGGSGTSSRMVVIAGESYTVGAFVQSNFGSRHELSIRGVPVGRLMPENALLTELSGHEHGSIIVVIGTDAPMLPIQLQRLARRGAIGIGRTGTSGGHYSGDIMLAFSVANEIYLPAIGEEQPRSFALECINDAHCDTLHEAAVQAVEEAVINALVAAESVPTCKPPGYVLEAIDHDRLRAVLREYGRLNAEGAQKK